MNIFDSWIVKTPVAHRGLHDENVPELSLDSFQKSIDAGYAIEIDVRTLRDGTVVCFHDETLGRMTGHDGFISNCNFSDIADLKLLKTNEHIPTLKEALKFIDGRTPVLIDIKNMDKTVEFEKNVWKELKSYKGEYAIQSFSPKTLEWFKLNAPQVKRGQISSFMKGTSLPFLERCALKRMYYNKKVSEPNFINYALEDLPNRYVNKCKKQGLPLLCFCVKNEEDLAKAKKLADNFIFDNVKP